MAPSSGPGFRDEAIKTADPTLKESRHPGGTSVGDRTELQELGVHLSDGKEVKAVWKMAHKEALGYQRTGS